MSATFSTRGPPRSGTRPLGAPSAISASTSPTSAAATGCDAIVGTTATGPTAVVASTRRTNSWNCVARSSDHPVPAAMTRPSCAFLPA